jgi:hypothetical protein
LKQKPHEVCHYFMRRLFILLLLLGLPLLNACLPLNALPATEPPLPTETAPPTATIDWFPASATPTLKVLPTTTATPEMNPGIGKQIINDAFSNAKLWDTVNSELASATMPCDRPNDHAKDRAYDIWACAW